VPLVPESVRLAPSALAGRLQASVDQSGLFYEAHLGRWFRGELTLQQLAREPQMLLGRPPGTGQGVATPAPPPAASVRSPAASASVADTKAPGRPAMAAPAPVGETVAAPAGPGQTAFAPSGEPERAQENGALPAAVWPGGGADEPVHETLHGLLRHQLELLTTPLLRWQGDVWAGLFMALVIQPPAPRSDDTGGGGERDGEDGQAEVWQSELRLRSDDLGEIRVRLRLAPKQLSLVMNVDSAAVAQTLRNGGGDFSERLQALGFDQVRLNVEALGDE